LVTRNTRLLIGGASGVGMLTAIELHRGGVRPEDYLLVDPGAEENRQGGGLNLRGWTVAHLAERGINVPAVPSVGFRNVYRPENAPRVPVRTYPHDLGEPLVFTETRQGQDRQMTTWTVLDRTLGPHLPDDHVQPRRIDRVDVSGAHPVAILDNGDTIESEVLIDATGAASTIRHALQPACDPARLERLVFRAVVPMDEVDHKIRQALHDPERDGHGIVTAFHGHRIRFFFVPVMGPDGDWMLNLNVFMPASKQGAEAVISKKNMYTGLLKEGEISPQVRRKAIEVVSRLVPSELAVLFASASLYGRDLRLGVVGDYVIPNTGVVRVGDSGTPMPPDHGQGFNNGAQAGVELAQTLAPLLRGSRPGSLTIPIVEGALRGWEQEYATRSAKLREPLLALPVLQDLGGPSWADDAFGPNGFGQQGPAGPGTFNPPQ
jgi:2-polyprenyl-6-methoxyphenol hydroxylase-like FAD-dependent oxidoreductase